MKHLNLEGISKLDLWVLATRPKTLPAAVAPVVVGCAMAYGHQRFGFWPAMACLAVALLLQIGVNLANDYFDFTKGIDTEDRLGPVRVTVVGADVTSRVYVDSGDPVDPQMEDLFPTVDGLFEVLLDALAV